MNEAFERARSAYGTGAYDDATLEFLFPQLRESEDERIRKTLVKYFKRFNQEDMWNDEVSLKDIVVYLEKQKEEPKPAEWSEEDEENFKWFDKFFRAESVVLGGKEISQDKYLWFKSLHPQQKVEWSEKDEKHRQWILECLADGKRKVPEFAEQYQAAFDWLKSFRPPFKDREMKLKILKYLSTRCSSLEFEEVEDYLNNLRPSWKPSEEQMKALLNAEGYLRASLRHDSAKTIAELYEQLKKLKGQEEPEYYQHFDPDC